MEGVSPWVKGMGTGLQGDLITNLGSWAAHRGVPECHGFHRAGSGVRASDRPGGELACSPFSRGASSLSRLQGGLRRRPAQAAPLDRGGGGRLYSLPILQTQAWALPAPTPVGISLLTTVSSSGVQAFICMAGPAPSPGGLRPSNYPRCRLIPSTSAGWGRRAALWLCCKTLSLPSSLKNIHLCSMQQRGRLSSPGEPPG